MSSKGRGAGGLVEEGKRRNAELSPEEQFAKDQEDAALAKRLKRVRFERKTTQLSQFARETFLSGRTGIEPILGRRARSQAAFEARGPKRT